MSKKKENIAAESSVEQETEGQRPHVEMKRIAKKKDVWHLIQEGILTQIHFDFETFSLNKNFAQISSYGDALGDIAGNLISSEEYYIKRPDRYLPSPEALAVTRTSPFDLDEEDRLSHQVAMGKIAQRFDKGAMQVGDLELEEEEVSFAAMEKKGKDYYPTEHTETVLKYPLLDEDGNVLDDVRIHPERGKIAYRIDDDAESEYYQNIDNKFYVDHKDGSRWKLMEPRLLVSGYRVKWADLPWLRPNLVRAGFHPSNIFFTHSKSNITDKERPKNFVVDAYSIAMNVHLFGPGGEEGLKISSRVDSETGEKVPSAKLGLIMKENARYENPIRGVRAGLFMPDGSIFDEEKAHRSPRYDSQASFAVYNYGRELAPDIVKQMEQQGNERILRDMLPSNDLTDSYPPIYALLANNYPSYPSVDPVYFLGFDDQLGKMNKIMFMKLDRSLEHYSWNGKKLHEMSALEMKHMIQEQSYTPDCVVRIESMRKFNGAMRLDQTLDTEKAKDWDFEQIDANYRYMKKNPAVIEKIWAAVESINWDMRQKQTPANPMMEEEFPFSGFGEPNYLVHSYAGDRKTMRNVYSNKGKGAVQTAEEMLFERARDFYKYYYNPMDEILHRVILQPHPVEWSDDKEALKSFNDLCRKALNTKFKKKQWPYGDIFPTNARGGFRPFKTAEDARAFRWELKKRILVDFEAEARAAKTPYASGLLRYDYAEQPRGKASGNKQTRLLFANPTREFRVVDSSGRELTMDYINKQHPRLVNEKIENHEWQIEFYQLTSRPSVTAALFQFADSGRLNELSPAWQFQYEALKDLYLKGPANEENVADDKARWLTIDAFKRTLQKLEVNAPFGEEGGIARKFRKHTSGRADVLAHNDESQRIIGECWEWIDQVEHGMKPSPLKTKSMGYDPESGLPYERIRDIIPAKKFVTITVPDTHLRRPLEDRDIPPYSLIVKKVSQSARDKIAKGYHVILKGQQTGRRYYAGPINFVRQPAEEGRFADYYEQARRAYKDEAGVPFPTSANRNIIQIQALEPIANTRQDIDPSTQTVKVPALFFDGLVCPRLAHFEDKEPLTGLVLPADYCPQVLQEGKPIRFREMNAPMCAKLSGEDGRETGNIYESEKLKSVKRMRVADLYAAVSDGKFTNKDARRYGFAGAFDMWEKVQHAFLKQESANPSAEEILLVEFEQVDKNSWAYFNPTETPRAALSHDGNYVPPSAYRSFKRAAANDNSSTAPAPSEIKAQAKPKKNGTDGFGAPGLG